MKKLKDEIVNMQIARHESMVQLIEAHSYISTKTDLKIIYISYASIAMEAVLTLFCRKKDI